MKIVHVTHLYFDGWGFQDNLLPEYQYRQGDVVTVISDNDHLGYMHNPEKAQKIISRGCEYEIDGVKIRKVKCFLNTSNVSFIYRGLYEALCEEQPDLLLLHSVDISMLIVAAMYKIRHNLAMKLYVDSHADYINESRNRMWNFCFNSVCIPAVTWMVRYQVDKFFGVTPLRCDYLHHKFRIPWSKIGFLPIGCDTNRADSITCDKKTLREIFAVPQNAFVIVSGGKMDASKGTLALIEACRKLQSNHLSLHLVLFGSSDEAVKVAIEREPFITSLGWCDRDTTLKILKMSDVGCWPWLHTTLIEDAVSCGTPIIVKASGNVRHFQSEENGIFLESKDSKELEKAITNMIHHHSEYIGNSLNARKKYSYETIAKVLKGDLPPFDYC